MKSYLTNVLATICLLMFSCGGENSSETSSEFSDSTDSTAAITYLSKEEKLDSISLLNYIDTIKSLHLNLQDEKVLLDTSTTNYLNNLGSQNILKYWIERSRRPEKIIEGKEVIEGTSESIHELPFMVGIQDRFGEFQCGGTIIGDRWILTAAHCFEDLSSKWDILLLIGTHLNTRPGDFLLVDSLHRFPNASQGLHDIGLIELKEPIDRNVYANIETVQIPKENEAVAQVGETVFVAGWGWTSSAGDVSPVLMKGALAIADLDACKLEGDCVLDDTHLATQNVIVDICSHDSGGPLYKQINLNGNLIKLQIGIVQQSCTGHCGDPSCNKFVNLSKYRKWIDTTISNNPPTSI